MAFGVGHASLLFSAAKERSRQHELKQKERIEEQEKNKFIEIVSDNENEIVSEAQKEEEKSKKIFRRIILMH